MIFSRLATLSITYHPRHTEAKLALGCKPERQLPRPLYFSIIKLTQVTYEFMTQHVLFPQ